MKAMIFPSSGEMSISRDLRREGDDLRQLLVAHHRAAPLEVRRCRNLHVQAQLPRRLHLRRLQHLHHLQQRRNQKIKKRFLLHFFCQNWFMKAEYIFVFLTLRLPIKCSRNRFVFVVQLGEEFVVLIEKFSSSKLYRYKLRSPLLKLLRYLCDIKLY